MSDSKGLFLAISDDPEFWDLDADEVILLGEWCLTYSQRDVLEGLSYKVMDCPWHDNEKLDEARTYVDKVYEEILSRLSVDLNLLHQTSYNREFWQILLAPWLQEYVKIMYDHYSVLKEVFSLYPNIKTIAVDSSMCVVPNDSYEFALLAGSDASYHLYIISRLIEDIDSSKIVSTREYPCSASMQEHRRGNFKRCVLKIKNGLRNKIAQSSQLLLQTAYFSPSQQMKLWLFSFGKIGFSNLDVKTNLYSIDPELRRNLIFELSSKDEFVRTIARLLPNDIPKVFTEGFHDLLNTAKQSYRKLFKTIISANAWWTNEVFKAYVGICKNEGSRLFGIQHGGSGTVNYENNSFEWKILDRFYTWGWESKRGKLQIVRAPAVKMVGAKKNKKGNAKILFINTVPSTFTIAFAKTGLYQRMYYADEIKFVDSLSDFVKEHLVLRPYRNFGNATDRYRERFPEIPIESLELNYMKSISKARMCVFDHLPSTTMLEALSKGIPLLLFWRHEFEDYTEEAEPIFEDLKKVQILHNSPESAAMLLNEICNDIEIWWNEPERQKAVHAFRDKFAYVPKNALKWWLNEFKEIIREDSANK